MKLLPQIFTANEVANLSTEMEERKAATKASYSLITVWATAVLILLFFIFFSIFNQPTLSFAESNASFIKLQKELKLNEALNDLGNLPGENDAFVFVNINKKFFLTRFPSGKQDETNTDINGSTVRNNISANKENSSVIRKVKAGTKRTPASDFSIKPVPQ